MLRPAVVQGRTQIRLIAVTQVIKDAGAADATVEVPCAAPANGDAY